MRFMSRGETVYLVDDDASVRKGLGRLLRAAGYDVHVFDSAEEFLSTPRAKSDACVILDARMPWMSGTRLQDEIRARGMSLPVIFVTAEGSVGTRESALAFGAVAFFHKPVDGPALINAIEWALDSHANRTGE